MRVKIIGAGSIGSHHARAARTMEWDVDVIDRDINALIRMKHEIYPKRYGEWDEAIRLLNTSEESKDGYDIIMIDTPPDVRMKLAIEVLKENSRLLHLEKPLCAPKFDCLGKFLDTSRTNNALITVGYNHAVSKSIEKVVEIIKSGDIGGIITIDIEFREHWQSIFDAHPWLKGPSDSYLGYWERGGGAGGEHSHALHLWLYLARVANLGAVAGVKSEFDIVDGKYDRVAAFILKTSNGNIGRVVQDVVTNPPRKWARVQGTKGYIEWHCNGGFLGGDLVFFNNGFLTQELDFEKTRQHDFLWLMQHYDDLLSGRASYKDSPLHIDFGIKVMNILHDAYYE